MIIVKLMGGLGNQMFQYAAGRSLALRHGVPLKLDLSFLEGDQPGDTRRCFELHHFNIQAVRASHWETALRTGRGRNFIEGVTARLLKKARGSVAYRENQFPVNPEFFSLPHDVHLDGYWQSEGYFTAVAEIIRRDLTLRAPLTGQKLKIAEAIAGVNAVSLHVRRGDYVSDPKTRAAHLVCDLDYYSRAVEVITDAVAEPVIFVFSDDPQWVAAHLKLRFPMYFVSYIGAAAHEDLHLMSLCRHHIIANSSFSWWGAWLNPRVDKTVCVPPRWFNEMPADTRDLIPAGWQKV